MAVLLFVLKLESASGLASKPTNEGYPERETRSTREILNSSLIQVSTSIRFESDGSARFGTTGIRLGYIKVKMFLCAHLNNLSVGFGNIKRY